MLTPVSLAGMSFFNTIFALVIDDVPFTVNVFPLILTSRPPSSTTTISSKTPFVSVKVNVLSASMLCVLLANDGAT